MTRHAYRAGLLAVAAITGLLISGCGQTAAPTSATPTPSTTAPASPGTTPATPPTSAPSTTGPVATTGLPAGYLPLYPFADIAEVRAWQESYASGGHQPWHRSPDLTATAFAAWLGYTGVTEVAQHTVGTADAHVAIGVRLPTGRVSTAAVVHLVRFGSGQYAPWEVVGTDDTTFSFDIPAYGSTIQSPVTVGGKITGVDENIQVTVRTLHTQAPVGSYCCRPAGGTSIPWSANVTFHATSGQVITIAAATGGHVAPVERFAVTGTRAG